MFKLSLPKLDVWDEKREEFDTIGGQVVELEHSLYTIAGWEAKWKVPFAESKGISKDQLLDYIMNFMCQTPDIPRTSWLTINQQTINEIRAYMDDKMTATTIKRAPGSGRGRNQVVTAELLYFYMAQFGIPFECEHWHINRLMTLINVAAVKSAPPKKMGKKEAALQQAQLNARRRAATGSRG